MKHLQERIKDDNFQKAIEDQVDDLVDWCHGLATEAGWWTCLQSGQSTKFTANIPEKLMLIVSEVAEAMEGLRKDLMDDHIPEKTMFEMELADVLIRVCDLAGSQNINLGEAVALKLAYNASRADHQLSNRIANGGKKF